MEESSSHGDSLQHVESSSHEESSSHVESSSHSDRTQRSKSRKYTKRQNYKKSVNEKLTQLLDKFKNGEVDTEELVSQLTFKEVVPDVPYFRQTKSGAVACHGVKRESIVLYRDQWIKLSKVFMNGRNCIFNKFFYKK